MCWNIIFSTLNQFIWRYSKLFTYKNVSNIDRIYFYMALDGFRAKTIFLVENNERKKKI